MKQILQYLFEHKTLSREKAKEILVNMSRGQYNDAEMSAFITIFLMRSITIEELQGFRDALLELCVKIDLKGHQVMDIVGTGAMERIRLIFLHCRVLLWPVPDKRSQSTATMAHHRSAVLPM
jgi:anthranilate phosphoribosyltransferase